MTQAAQAYSDAERAQAQARHALEAAGREVEARAAWCTPAPDTLLAFLRAEHPGWAGDVARYLPG